MVRYYFCYLSQGIVNFLNQRVKNYKKKDATYNI